MKPLQLSLSLLAQSFKKLAFRDLFSEALQAQKEAKQIFGIEIPFILNAKKLNRNTFQQSGTQTLAEYDQWYDANIIYYKIIGALCQKYDVNFKLTFHFCFWHETGHAKEQRLFEEIGFCPNIIKTSHEGVPIKIESSTYLLRNPQIVSNIFTCGVCDFSINKELKKHNLTNQLSKKVFFDNTGLRPIYKEQNKTVLDCLLHLPHAIDIYEHGELSEIEKDSLKESQEKVVGDKWEKTLSKLKEIEFSNPKSKTDIILELIKNTLGIKAFLGFGQKREILFRRYSTIPKFWKKERYQVIYL